jgi:hypothetical protein
MKIADEGAIWVPARKPTRHTAKWASNLNRAFCLFWKIQGSPLDLRKGLQ